MDCGMRICSDMRRKLERRWRCSDEDSTGHAPADACCARISRACAPRLLGPADYLAIAERFDTVFIEAIPRLRPDRRDEARRLATLIDTLYEAHTRLVVLADGEPETLYPIGRSGVRVRTHRVEPQ